ncbi:MAG: hypothetical protein AB7O80_20195 [Acetobacteraceae bacterium]
MPRVKLTTENDRVTLSVDHPDQAAGSLLLMDALGTADEDFCEGFLSLLANAGAGGRDTDLRGINFMLSVVKSIQPRDELEALLGAQMAAVHVATMTFARRLAYVETLQERDSAERAFNRLARTFSVQMEALKRYRTGGEQKVIVQHVTVNDGGQAIVGNVAKRGTGVGDE